MAMYTAIQLDSAREEIIAAFEGFQPRHNDQFESHGIFSVSSESRAFQIAVFNALGIDTTDMQIVEVCSKSKTGHITKGHQRVKGSSKALVNDHVFKQCRLIRSLSKMNPVAQAWMSAAYLSQDSEPLIRMMTELYRKHNKIRKGTEQVVNGIVIFAIRAAIDTALDRKQVQDSVIASELGMTRQTFHGSWKARMNAITDTLCCVDEQCLEMLCFELDYQTYSPSIKLSKAMRTNLIAA